jgi:hypothetical protein
MGLELLIGWLILATLVGIWAGRRGHNAGQWGFIALVLSPLLAWLILLAIGPAEAEPAVPSDVEESLARLAAMADQGLITDEEYAEKRRDVLARI